MRESSIRVSFVFLLISFLFIFNALAQQNVSSVIENILPSVVILNTDKRSGSGVVISEDGYILTNKHIIDDSRFMEVEFSDGKKLNANFIGEDSYNDMAILKVNTKDRLVPVVSTDKEINVGDDIIVLGNLNNLGISVSKGIVSALKRKHKDTKFVKNMQLSVATGNGNSGGAVFNTNGEIVGLIFANHTKHNDVTFAIPFGAIVNTIDEIKKFGSVKYADIGVMTQSVSGNVLDILGVKNGVIITNVLKNSAAEKSGLLPSDILVQYGDFKINNTDELTNLIYTTEIDSTINVLIFRNKKFKSVSVKVIEKKDDVIGNYIELFGMYLLPIDKTVTEKFNISNDLLGLYVHFVDVDSVADISGLKSGDILLYVNQKQVTDKKTLLDSINVNRNNVLIIKSEQENKVLLLRNK